MIDKTILVVDLLFISSLLQALGLNCPDWGSARLLVNLWWGALLSLPKRNQQPTNQISRAYVSRSR